MNSTLRIILMRKLLLSLPFIFLIFGCTEDVGPEITTDPIKEGNQLFILSKIWGENSFFGLLSLMEYQSITSEKLPGCPKIIINTEQRKVTLDFDQTSACEQIGVSKRKGKIHLEYSSTSSSLPTWTMNFEDYKVDDIQLSGTKIYTRKDFRTIQESAENLKVRTATGLSHQFESQVNHTLTVFNLRLIGFSSVGQLAGINPAGRSFTWDITTPRAYLVSCIQNNQILPISGLESFQIQRGKSSSFTYKMSYSATGDCNSQVQLILPDGQTISPS